MEGDKVIRESGDKGKKLTKNSSKPLPPHSLIPPSPELNGRGGLDPTRYGDWEISGKCVDF